MTAEPKSILFVCIGNSCRSQMAEAFAHHAAGDSVHVASAGLSCARDIAPETIAVMRERGIDMYGQFPKDYEPALAEHYDIVVNISGFDLPRLQTPALVEWQIDDPNGEQISFHRAIRDEIEQRVRELLAQIERDGTVPPPDVVGQPIASPLMRKSGLWQRFIRWRACLQPRQ